MKNLSSFLTYCIITVSIALSGCTPEKARTLHTAAMQFKAESLGAIDAIDKMIEKEIAPTPRSEEEVRKEFVNNILNTRREITPEIVDLAIDPYTVDLSPDVISEKKALINDLRNQYIQFAAIFDRLESGSFLATPAVEKTEDFAKKLTVQMANFAMKITQNPPQFLQSKNLISDKIGDLRNEYQTISSSPNSNDFGNNLETKSFSNDARKKEIEREVGELMNQWLQIKAQEQKLAEETAKECLEAAILGQQLSILIQDYDRLSISDIESLIFQALETAASISGLDFDSLKVKTKQVSDFLTNDPYFQDAVELLQQNNLQINKNTSNLSPTLIISK